ncbi:hypothetical protein [Desulforudis sp. 1088]
MPQRGQINSNTSEGLPSPPQGFILEVYDDRVERRCLSCQSAPFLTGCAE